MGRVDEGGAPHHPKPSTTNKKEEKNGARSAVGPFGPHEGPHVTLNLPTKILIAKARLPTKKRLF